MGQHEPHPYALLLPSLTAAEYAALKTDIAAHGIMYPAICDEDGRILDGVHRARIAGELGIDLPVAIREGLDEDRKLHLAVGLNMRRRHLDGDKRRELVRKLHKDEKLSLRRIASVTGWSKSTIDRDLKESPYEAAVKHAEGLRNLWAEVRIDTKDPAVRKAWKGISDAWKGLTGDLVALTREADTRWKQGEWPHNDLAARLKYELSIQAEWHALGWVLQGLQAMVHKTDVTPPKGCSGTTPETCPSAMVLADKAKFDKLLKSPDVRVSLGAHLHVPDGTVARGGDTDYPEYADEVIGGPGVPDGTAA